MISTGAARQIALTQKSDKATAQCAVALLSVR